MRVYAELQARAERPKPLWPCALSASTSRVGIGRQPAAAARVCRDGFADETVHKQTVHSLPTNVSAVGALRVDPTDVTLYR